MITGRGFCSAIIPTSPFGEALSALMIGHTTADAGNKWTSATGGLAIPFAGSLARAGQLAITGRASRIPSHLMTGGGIGTFTMATLDAYINMMRYWMDHTIETHAWKRGDVTGVTLFTSGGGDQWKWFEVKQPEMSRIAEAVNSYMSNIDRPPLRLHRLTPNRASW